MMAGGHGLPLQQRMIGFVTKRILQNDRSLRIVDYGCGNGGFVVAMKKAGFDAVGVDITAEYVQIAKAKCESMGVAPDRITLISEDRLPFPPESFDCVYSNTVLEHVRDVDSYLSECRRVLKRSGILFCTVPVRFSLIEGHIPLPLAHWLPAGRLRRFYIRALAQRGMHELGAADIGQYFDEYICRLNYWTPSVWKEVFRRYFRTVREVTLEKKQFEAAHMPAHLFYAVSKIPVAANALLWLVRQTTTMNLIAAEPLP